MKEKSTEMNFMHRKLYARESLTTSVENSPSVLNEEHLGRHLTEQPTIFSHSAC